MYEIRSATPLDFEGINFVSAHLGYKNLSNDESKRKLDQLFNSETDFVYVAESKGIIIAWLHLFLARRLASNDFFEIGGLVVNPNQRGQGVGKSLINHVMNKHQSSIRVRCNQNRTEAHKFYEKISFENKKVQNVFEKQSHTKE
ncbi:MAG: GNAT family N-acetyltransferase [Campylobacteraceae bacterium]|nr:GNAT family N-acetyltransferase [Campylobacteraceae bacterium]